MRHDQLAKTLISTFFADFLRLTLPDSAPRLRLGEAVFLDKEVFTDWPTIGRRRELDLLARVPVEKEDACLLVHVEIEARAGGLMQRRLWWYYMQVRLRYDLQVLPILVNLRGGRPGVELVAVEEGFEPLATGMFRYRALGLSGCRAVDWLARPEPVAWAFAALMHPGEWSPAELKVECLRRVQQSNVAGLREDLLVNWIETYVQLSEEDAAEYRRLLALKKNKEIRRMDQTWLGKAEAQGFRRGKAEGKAETVDRMKRMVLKRIEQRFGAVPEPVQARVQEIASLERLVRLFEKVPSLRSAEDLLPHRNGKSNGTAA
ncbi:MAG TPA: hypothetical protein VKM72_27950 [Thermoanaerobaculia bacterium]|nr:hypothetical protein [Thermoanaerobaculia bacterium]